MIYISVKDKLPPWNKKVIATYLDYRDCRVWVMAEYVPRFTIESYEEYGNDEYCENTDTYYVCEGWYESLENHSEYNLLKIDGDVDYWCEEYKEWLI